MKLFAAKKSEQNGAMFDPWTAVHFSSGMAMGLTRVGAWPALWLAVAYEVTEQVFERSDAGKSFFNISGPETPENVVGDLAIYMIGWYLGNRWNDT